LNVFKQPKLQAKECVPLLGIITEAKNYSKGPVVVFPEGITTNGNILIGCIPVIPSGLPIPSTNFHILSFKYPSDTFSPVYTVGNPLVHLIRLCSQIGHSISISYIIDQDIPSETENPEWAEQVYNLLAAAMQKSRGKIQANQKFPFMDYWFDHKAGYKK